MSEVAVLLGKARYKKILEWGRLLAITGGAQAIVQAIGLISGILVIRTLSTDQYALYILANTMLGTMILLADGGITTGVMSQGGKVWQDRAQLGSVMVTGMHLRKKFAIVSSLISIPILAILLTQHGANWIEVILIIISIIPAFFAALSGSLLEIAPKLNQDIQELQKIQVITNIGRFLLLVLTLLVFPFAFIAILASGLPQIWSNKRLTRLSSEYVDRNQSISPKVRSEILSVVKKIIPGAIYFCLSGQITIWLVSMFGSTKAIAQVGALGRLAMVLNLFLVILSTLIIPRFARVIGSSRIVLRRFFQIQGVAILTSLFVIAFVMLFPNEILSILGHSYTDLTKEIVIMAVVACMGLMVGVTYSTTISRGVVLTPAINITGHILTQVVCLFLLDLSKTSHVLFFALADHCIAFAMLTTNFIYRTVSA